MLAARITSPQSLASALTNSPISLVSSLLASTKIVLSFACASGVCMAATIALFSLVRISADVLGGAINEKKVDELNPLTPLSSIVGTVGLRQPVERRGGDDPDPAALMQRQDGAEVPEHRVHMTAGEVVHGGRRAPVGDVHELDARPARKQLRGQMCGRAVALRGVAEFSRVGLGESDQVGNGLGGRTFLHCQNVGGDRLDRPRLERGRIV